MDLLTRDTVQKQTEWQQCRKTAENIMGHECKNTEVGVGRDAQVEVIPWTMGRGGVDRSMEFDRIAASIYRCGHL